MLMAGSMHIQQVVDKRLNRLFLVSLLRISLIISLVEGLIMLFLHNIATIIPIQENVLDTLLLILVGSPLLWIVVLKPLVKVIATQQKITTEQIRVNAELRMALDAHALVSICDTGGRIIYVNDKFCELSGYSQDELLGKDHPIINSGYHDNACILSGYGKVNFVILKKADSVTGWIVPLLLYWTKRALLTNIFQFVEILLFKN